MPTATPVLSDSRSMTWRLEDGVVFEQEWDAENWLVSVVNWAALVVSALLLAPLVPLRRRARD